MFTFNCQTCGFKMGDFPPLEALTKEQRAVVPGAEQEPGLGVLPPPFENYSSYQFCSFCLLAMEQDVTAFERRGVREGETFRSLGMVVQGVSDWDQSFMHDHVFANRFMIFRELDKEKMSNELLTMFIDYHDEVKERQLASIQRQKEQEEYEKTLKFKVRRAYFRLRMKLRLPYHLDRGLRLLWWTLTMPKSWDEDQQADFYEVLAWEGQNWEYENDKSAPFAKFELWAMQKHAERFFHIYNEENNS